MTPKAELMFRWSQLLCVFIFSFHSTGQAQGGWELEKDENGIKVFVRENSDSSFDEFKATMTLSNSSLNKALQVILEVNNYEAWFPDCANPKVLEQIDAFRDIYYIETKSPWPIDNRCGVYRQTATLSEDNTKAEIVFVADPNYPIEIKNMVRITEGVGIWTLEQNDDKLTIAYQFKGNPGGDIPAWIANAFVVKHPFETLSNFKMILAD